MSGGPVNGHYSSGAGFKTDFRTEGEFQSTSQERTQHADFDETRTKQTKTINLEELKSRETTRIATADDVRALLEAEFKGIAEIQTSKEISVEEFNYIESQYRKSLAGKVDSQTRYTEEHRLENVLENPEWKKHYGVPVLKKNEIIDVKEMTVVEKNYKETIPSSTLNASQTITSTGDSLMRQQHLQGSNPQITVTMMEHPEGYGSLRHELKQKRHVLEEHIVEENEIFYDKTATKKSKRISANIEKSRSTGELQTQVPVVQTHSETVAIGTFPRSGEMKMEFQENNAAGFVGKSPKKKVPQSELVLEDANLFTDEKKRHSWFTSDIKIKPLFPNRYKHYVVNKTVDELLSEDKKEKNLVATRAAETRESNLSLGGSTKKLQKEIVVCDIETFKDGKLEVEPHDYTLLVAKSDEGTLRLKKHKLEDTETKVRPKSKIPQEEMVLNEATVYEDTQFKSLKKPKKKFFTLPKMKTMPPKFKVKAKYKIKKYEDIVNEASHEVDFNKNIHVAKTIKKEEGQIVLEDSNVYKETTTIKSKDIYSASTLEKQRQMLSDMDREAEMNSRGAYSLSKTKSSQQEIVLDDPNVFRETTLTRKHKEKPSKLSNKILNDILVDVSNLDKSAQESAVKTETKQVIQSGNDVIFDYKKTEPDALNVNLQYKTQPQREIVINGEETLQDSTHLKFVLERPRIVEASHQIADVVTDKGTLEQGELVLEDKTIYEDRNKPKKIILEHGQVMHLAELDDVNLPSTELLDEVDAKLEKENKIQPSKKKKRLKLKFGKKHQGESVKDKSFVYEDATKIRFPTLPKKGKSEKIHSKQKIEKETKEVKETKEPSAEDKPFWNWGFEKQSKPQEEVIKDETHYHEDVANVHEAAVDVPSREVAVDVPPNHDTQKFDEGLGDKLGKFKIKFPSLPKPAISFGSKKTQEEIVVNEQNVIQDDTKLVVNLETKDLAETEKDKKVEEVKETTEENVDMSTQATQTTPQDTDESSDKNSKFKIHFKNFHIPKPHFQQHESKPAQEELVIQENVSNENEVVDENKKITFPNFHLTKPHLDLKSHEIENQLVIDETITAIETSERTKIGVQPTTHEIDVQNIELGLPSATLKKPDVEVDMKINKDETKSTEQILKLTENVKIELSSKEPELVINLPQTDVAKPDVNLNYEEKIVDVKDEKVEECVTLEEKVVRKTEINIDEVKKETKEIVLEELAVVKEEAEVESQPEKAVKQEKEKFKIHLPNIHFKKSNFGFGSKVEVKEQTVENEAATNDTVQTAAGKESKFKIHLPHINFKKPSFTFGSKHETKEVKEKSHDDKQQPQQEIIMKDDKLASEIVKDDSNLKIILPQANVEKTEISIDEVKKETKEIVLEELAVVKEEAEVESKIELQKPKVHLQVVHKEIDSKEPEIEIILPHPIEKQDEISNEQNIIIDDTKIVLKPIKTEEIVVSDVSEPTIDVQQPSDQLQVSDHSEKIEEQTVILEEKIPSKSFEEVLVDQKVCEEPQNEVVKQEEIIQDKSSIKVEAIPEVKITEEESEKTVEETKKSKGKFKFPSFTLPKPNFKMGFKSLERKNAKEKIAASETAETEKQVESVQEKKDDSEKKSKFKIHLPHLGTKTTQNEIIVGDIPVIPDDSKVVVELKKSHSGLIEDIDRAVEEEVVKIENDALQKTLERPDKTEKIELSLTEQISSEVSITPLIIEDHREEKVQQPEVVSESTNIIIEPTMPTNSSATVEDVKTVEIILETPNEMLEKTRVIEKIPQDEIVVDESLVVTDQTKLVVAPSKLEVKTDLSDVNAETNFKIVTTELQAAPSIELKTDLSEPSGEIVKLEEKKQLDILTDTQDLTFLKSQGEKVIESSVIITERTVLDVAKEHVVSDNETEDEDSKKEKVKSTKSKMKFPHFKIGRKSKKPDQSEAVVESEQVVVQESTAEQNVKNVAIEEVQQEEDKTDTSKTNTLETKKEKKKFQNPFAKIHFGRKQHQKELTVHDGHIYTDNSTLGKKKKGNVISETNVYIVENDLPESRENKTIVTESEKVVEGESVVEKITETEIVEKEITQKKEKIIETSQEHLTDSGKPKKSNKILNIFHRNSGEYDLEHPSKTNQPLVELISSKPKLATSSTDDVSNSKEPQVTPSSKHQSNLTLDSSNKPAFESECRVDSSKSVENVQLSSPSLSSSLKQVPIDSNADVTFSPSNIQPSTSKFETSTPLKSTTDQMDITTATTTSQEVAAATTTPATDDKLDLAPQPSPEDQDEETQKHQLNWTGSTGRNTSYFSTVSRVTTCHDERTPLQFVVVAIDFGTTFSGYAFSFTKDVDSIHVMRKWEGGDPGVTNQKTPTILLLTPEKNFHSFGFTARDFYHDLSQKEAKRWLYFEKFKMALHYNADLTSETEIQAANGVSMRAIDVFAHALKFFRNHALLEISEQSNTPLNEDDIRWVITVPAIWKSPAKQFMREAAYKACIASQEKPDQLIIALEPEAASVFVRRQRLKQLIPEVADELKDARVTATANATTTMDNGTTTTTNTASTTTTITSSPSPTSKSPPSPVLLDVIAHRTSRLDDSGSLNHSFTSNAMSMSFQRCPSPTSLPVSVGHEIDITDNRFMVADCGGGTVDITVYEMLSATGGQLKEVYKATGGPYGSIGVDIAFEKLLEDIFGIDFIDILKLKRPAGWIDLMMAFESRKRAANPFKTKPLNVSLPFSFIDYHKKFRNSTVESAVRKYNNKYVKWSSQGMLRLMPEAMDALFQPTLDNITVAINNVMSQTEVVGIRYIFLVGGFSESPMLQQEVRRKFEDKVKILIPNDVSMAILKGAVIFGIDPSVVVIRKSRLTYGLGVLNRFVEGKHPESKKALKDGTPWCVDVFDPLVLANQSVALGSSVIRSYTPASLDQKYSLFHIYCSENREVNYVTDVGVAKCGTLRLDLDNHQWELESNPSRPVSQHVTSGGVTEVGSANQNARSDEAETDAVGFGIGGMDVSRGRREIQARLTFGDTEIKIVALDVATGNYVRATLDFLNK